MKKRSQNITQELKSVGVDRFTLSFGGIDIRRRSDEELELLLSGSLETLKRVVVNGEVFHHSDSLQEVVRIAPMKYADNHFKEVNNLQRTRCYSTTAALGAVADKYGFNHESFRRQYYARGWHGPKKIGEQ